MALLSVHYPSFGRDDQADTEHTTGDNDDDRARWYIEKVGKEQPLHAGGKGKYDRKQIHGLQIICELECSTGRVDNEAEDQ